MWCDLCGGPALQWGPPRRSHLTSNLVFPSWQGRRWEELAPHFEALWGMTLRVIDDIKESVRVAGVALAR